MDVNWSIRKYIDGDESAINDLFNTIFNKARTLDHWIWKFKKSPKKSKILVAVHNNRVIGHLASLNRDIKMGNRSYRASLEVDGMTHPDFGHRGIFISLGKRLLSESQKEGMDIVIGFPNEFALPGHRKLNCKELFSLHVMIRPNNYRNLSKKMFSNKLLCLFAELTGKFVFKVFFRVRKSKIEEDITIKKVTEFDDRYHEFWEKAKSSYPIILFRDKEYMNWRYVECPDSYYQNFTAEKDGRILAVVVVRILDKYGLNNGAIVDVLALPDQEQVTHALLLSAIRYLEERKVDLVACSVPKWSIYNDVLKKCGFMKCPKRLNPKEEPFIIYPISKEIDFDFVNNPNNWYITWGDTDVM